MSFLRILYIAAKTPIFAKTVSGQTDTGKTFVSDWDVFSQVLQQHHQRQVRRTRLAQPPRGAENASSEPVLY